MSDTMTNAWFHRLKAANRMLIKLNGGIEESARLASISKSQIGRCNSAGDTELLPITATIRLEAECGEPVVTRAMAELHGCALVNPKDKPVDGRCIMRDNAELQRLNGEFQVSLANASADLVVTPAEALVSLRNLEQLKRKLPDLETALTEIIASGGARTGLRVVGECE
ncbi:hypothetical protein [Mycoplana rhizolycopersici]|uniref:Transcriptional regulator n=1 Tax=Mycoplana rhizolycopersici TaxID=2746702 RepID=A0ABX2QKY8_9HYPH|nr:hypothetical protein [Rhizobium rhizolycopersici]NVP57898.1 hypothetical protein [Rhizobium rhizolycopersici]